METAYHPPPDPAYAMQHYGNEEYFVLRQPSPRRISAGTKEWMNQSEDGGRQSLPIKFKAKRPEKQCQTDGEHLGQLKYAVL